MIDSVILARDRWLKPDGSMWPSHATLLWSALIEETGRYDALDAFIQTESTFPEFEYNMLSNYGINMSYFKSLYTKENEDYYIYNSEWKQLYTYDVVGNPSILCTWDLLNVTLDDVDSIRKTTFDIHIPDLIENEQGQVIRMPLNLNLTGFAGWFSVIFDGTSSTTTVKAKHPITLSTGPEVGITHWGQQVFYLQNVIPIKSGDIIHGNITMKRKKDNKRTYKVIVDLFRNDNNINSTYLYDLN